jgi:hypothetical protein
VTRCAHFAESNATKTTKKSHYTIESIGAKRAIRFRDSEGIEINRIIKLLTMDAMN